MSRTRNLITIARGTIAENARRQMSLLKLSQYYKSETKVSEGSLASEKGLISALALSHKSKSDL